MVSAGGVTSDLPKAGFRALAVILVMAAGLPLSVIAQCDPATDPGCNADNPEPSADPAPAVLESEHACYAEQLGGSCAPSGPLDSEGWDRPPAEPDVTNPGEWADYGEWNKAVQQARSQEFAEANDLAAAGKKKADDEMHEALFACRGGAGLNADAATQENVLACRQAEREKHGLQLQEVDQQKQEQYAEVKEKYCRVWEQEFLWKETRYFYLNQSCKDLRTKAHARCVEGAFNERTYRRIVEVVTGETDDSPSEGVIEDVADGVARLKPLVRVYGGLDAGFLAAGGSHVGDQIGTDMGDCLADKYDARSRFLDVCSEAAKYQGQASRARGRFQVWECEHRAGDQVAANPSE
jgi:hypothetical protein